MADKRAATRLGEALRRYLSRAGLKPRLDQASVVKDWPQLVGDKIAAISEPESVTQEGTLFVRVKSAPWMQELHMLTPDILSRLEGMKIKRIVWRAW